MPEIQFLLACFGMSCVITYAVWLRFRVWRFRQDLFSIRDRMWAEMLADGTLDDPSHRQLRDAINALIRLAPYVSLMTMLNILITRQEVFTATLVRRNDLPAVLEARRQVVVRTAKYLLLETISGVLSLGLFGAFGMAHAIYRAVNVRIDWLLDTRAFEEIHLPATASV